MKCQRFSHGQVQVSEDSSFNTKAAAGGMIAGYLLLCGAMQDWNLGLKWNYGDCNCQDRPTLSSGLRPVAVRLAETPRETVRSSPLPVASNELRGAAPGQEPKADLSGVLTAFSSNDLYREDAAPSFTPAAAPAAQYSTAFQQVQGLAEQGSDELVPLRARRGTR